MNDLIGRIVGAVRSCTERFQEEDTSGKAEDSGHVPWGYAFGYADTPSEKCKTVTISKRALTALLAEAYANGDNETGGPFFGQIERQEGNWYIVETTSPGYGAYHSPTRHEMNNRFVNYQYRALSRIYAKELTLVGFWHRHPGLFSRFSGLDDPVNASYAQVIGYGTISILLNLTSDGPLFTCYYLDPEDGLYHLTPLVVDSQALAKKGFLVYATPTELAQRAEDMQSDMAGIA